MKEKRCSICKDNIEENKEFEKYLNESALKEIDKYFEMPANLEKIDICSSCSKKLDSFWKKLGNKERILTKPETDELRRILENKENNIK